jgi:hypothetical protein
MFRNIFKKRVGTPIPISSSEACIPPTKVSEDSKDLRVVVSFSLYGDVERYIYGLYENCKIINKIYPDFWIYVFIGNDFNHDIFDGKLDTFSNVLLFKTEKSGLENRSHRFFAIDFPEVDIMFSRDLDSIVNLRDQYCINKFIESDKRFQIIRDNRNHSTEILAGMWGIKKGLVQTKIRDLFDKFKSENLLEIVGQKHFEIESDQHFLTRFIYPVVKHESLVFDEYFNYPGETPQKIIAPIIYFPESNGYDFVGRPVSNFKETFEIKNN